MPKGDLNMKKIWRLVFDFPTFVGFFSNYNI